MLDLSVLKWPDIIDEGETKAIAYLDKHNIFDKILLKKIRLHGLRNNMLAGNQDWLMDGTFCKNK